MILAAATVASEAAPDEHGQDRIRAFLVCHWDKITISYRLMVVIAQYNPRGTVSSSPVPAGPCSMSVLFPA